MRHPKNKPPNSQSDGVEKGMHGLPVNVYANILTA